MQWAQAIDEYLVALKPVKINTVALQHLYQLIDLTSLNAADTDDSLLPLFEKTRSPLGHVAAICVYPPFVRLAATQFAGGPVKVATVANFPEGLTPLENVLIEINQALENGAQEIDVVFPYERYLAGEQHYAQDFVSACRAACGASASLKVILETGALNDLAIIADACFVAIAGGADFVKTSTGKIDQGATLEAAAVMLLVIKHARPQLKHQVGIKFSGGIKDIEQALQYIQLTENMMGKNWVSPDTVRIGASRLVDAVLGYSQA